MIGDASVWRTTRNGAAVPRREIPVLSPTEFRDAVLAATGDGGRLAALAGEPVAAEGVRLLAVVADDRESLLGLTSTVVRERYPALTPDCSQAHWFERELAEQWSIRPEGHPWLKPIRFHQPYRPRPTAGAPPVPGVTDFFQVEGAEVHEVAVGPVHAGVIEPGHFRFQCRGEEVLHLEIALGYQHRGIERALRGAPNTRTVPYMETLAGDTTAGHTLAYCAAIEGLARCAVPARAHALRAIALELERMANHAGDLGALAGDVGFLPTAAYCGRLRGALLNVTAGLCGSRFGRGWIRPGGVRFDAEPALAIPLGAALDAAMADLTGAIALLWDTPSVPARFEETGTLTPQACEALGLVGVVARACGIARDVRQDQPFGLYRFAQIPVSTAASGDVLARAQVRWLELQRSAAFVGEQLAGLPSGPLRTAPGALHPDTLVASLVEGWRGEICHLALTDTAGRFAAYKIVDPSFHNWMGLALALRGEAISDFPLCNKSFNLSYCGHDL